MDRIGQLVERAVAAAGHDDFGGDGWREGLERLVASVDREARLTQQGAAAMDAQIVDLLAWRLEVEHAYARHPEIDAEEIVAPLIGLGLPRTGSTALAAMLAEDPAARSIRNWEAQAPCPPPETATEADDPRIAAAEAFMRRRAAMFPRMAAMVPSTATGPTECQTFMAHDMKSQLFQAFVRVPAYADWLAHEADLVPTYRYVKRVLKLLQWRCPPVRWRLKNPSHILFIDALDRVFPDARYWMTHRDIARVIPSVCDLYLEISRAFSDDVDLHWLGRHNVETWDMGMRRLIAFRDAGRDERFCDIQFADFQRDPMPEIERLYRFTGEALTDEARARMAAWRQAMPRDEQAIARTDPAAFGLDAEALRERFRFYTERFGVGEA